MVAIEVRGLRKSYGTFEALRGIDLDVHEGEVLAVLGPNGAGKTTLVEILEGYRKRDAGTVAVLGTDPEHGGLALRERIGLVLQETAVDAYLTVREVLQMHAGYYRAPRAVDEVIQLVGLTEKAAARVKTLSGGQQRRLDMGLGLIGDPELLFLDEPTTGFDPTARRQAWSVISDLCDLGKTVLLTTHYMDEAQHLADRVAVVVAGQIVAEGPPSDLAGRSTAPTRIEFGLPPGASVTDLPVPPTSVEDGLVVIEAHEPTELLHRLTGWALDRGAALDGLRVDRPSLEDVYLELTADPHAPTDGAS
jgi:ABC-2 type transport system ATP-binding protein